MASISNNPSLKSIIERRCVPCPIKWLVVLILMLPCLGHAQFRYHASNGNITIDRYTGNSSDLTIPSTIEGLAVTRIGEIAFTGVFSLTSVIIPDGVVSIGSSAFAGCTNLANVELPNTLTTIGGGAFSSCTALRNLTIPRSVTNIEGTLSGGNTRMSSIIVEPGNPNYVSVDGVLLDKPLTKLIEYPPGKTGSFSIPTGVTEIGEAAFSGCSLLEGIGIPESVTHVAGSAFDGCTGLLAVVVPGSVKTIGNGAFSGCISLTNLTILNGVTNVGEFAFYNCSSLRSVSVPPSIVTIGRYLFASCTDLANIVLSPGVASIGDFSFAGCAIATLLLPSSITNIGDASFQHCLSLTNIMIPARVANIGRGAFGECSAMLTIEVHPDNPTYASVDGVLFSKSLSTLFHYPEGRIGDFQIRSSVTNIVTGALGYSSRMTSITVNSKNLTYADVNGVLFDKSLRTLIRYPGGKIGEFIIPSTVVRIADFAFAACDGLSSVTIPGTVEILGVGTFAYCAGLKHILIPKSTIEIGYFAFYACKNLEAIWVDENNPAYSSAEGVLCDQSQTTLIQCPGGKPGSYIVPESVRSIEQEAFGWCDRLVSVTIPSGVTRIGPSAFLGCTRLSSVFVQGNAPNYINEDTFYGSENVTIYYLFGVQGWDWVYIGRPLVLWNPQIILTDGNLGVRGEKFEFTATGITNQLVVVEACTSLSQPSWSPVWTNELVNGSTTFSDPQWTNHAVRFYRLRYP